MKRANRKVRWEWLKELAIDVFVALALGAAILCAYYAFWICKI